MMAVLVNPLRRCISPLKMGKVKENQNKTYHRLLQALKLLQKIPQLPTIIMKMQLMIPVYR